MDAVTSALAQSLIDRLNQNRLLNAKLEATPAAPIPRVLVGICGVPASGKTTIAMEVTRKINAILASSNFPTGTSNGVTTNKSETAICVSQDGWHYSRATLDTFPDVREAYDRRGAAFTFDGVGFSRFVFALRGENTIHPMGQDTPTAGINRPDHSYLNGLNLARDVEDVKAPSFSHTLKDPTPDAITVSPHHHIVIIEGLYTFLSIEPWRAAADLLDERWFVDVDPVIGKARLVERHVRTGVAKDLTEAVWRAENNDIPNGEFIRKNMTPPTRVIVSADDPIIAAHGRVE